MRNLTSIFAVFIIIILGCSKNTSDDEERFEGYMKAKINGELVIFDYASGDGHFNMEKDCFEPFHRIIGGWEFNASDGHLIVLNFIPSQGIGTYNPRATYITWVGPYNDGINNVGYNQNHFCVADQTHYEEEGSVTITSTENNRYKGIFHFTAADGCRENIAFVTNGEFEINQKLPRSCE